MSLRPEEKDVPPVAADPAPGTPEIPTRNANQELLEALAGRNARGSQAAAERARRAIRVSVDTQRETREQKRFHLGVATAVFGILLLLLGPGLWSSIDDLFGGEHFSDTTTQIAFLILVLLVAIVAALIAGWKTRASSSDGREA